MTCDLYGPNFVGDPVEVVTGEVRDRFLDFEIYFAERRRRALGVEALISQGRSLQFFRWYSSDLATDVDRGVGFGHWHTFDWAARTTASGVIVDFPGGRTRFPGLFRDGAEAASKDFDGYILHRVAEHHLVLRKSGEPTRHLVKLVAGSRFWLLARLEHDDGGTTDFFYEAGKLGNTKVGQRLVRVQDSDGYELHFTWNGAHLQSIHGIGEVFSRSRTQPSSSPYLLVEYQYSARGDLLLGRDSYGKTFRYDYDLTHNVLRREDRRGYGFVYSYDDIGRCIRVAGDDGVDGMRIDYDDSACENRVVFEANGAEFLYRYLPSKHLVDITYPDGKRRQFILDASGRPQQEVDAEGNLTQYVYGAGELFQAKLDALGQSRGEKDDPSTSLAPSILEQTPSTVHACDGAAPLVPYLFRPASAQVLADKRVPTSLSAFLVGSEFLGSWRHIRDAHGLLIRAEQIFLDTRTGQPSALRKKTFGYDENGNLRHVRDSDGGDWFAEFESWNQIRLERDPLGNVFHYAHNKRDLMTSVRDPGGTVTEYEWDLRDRLHAVIRNGKLIERYVRDGIGALVEKRILARDESGIPFEATLVRYQRGPLGTLVGQSTEACIDGFGVSESFKNDASGACIEAKNAHGTFTFDTHENGRRCKDERTSPDFSCAVYKDYQDGQLVRIRVRLHKDGPDFVTHYHASLVDKDGSTFGTREPARLIRFEEPGIHSVQILDASGRAHVLRRPQPGIVLRTFSSGVREISQYDTAGRVLVRAHDSYDPMDRKPRPAWEERHAHVEEKERFEEGKRALLRGDRWTARYALRSAVTPAFKLLRCTYSGEGRLLQREGDVQGAIRYRYDAAQRLIAADFPSGETHDYVHDVASNLRKKPGLREGWVASDGKPALAMAANTLDSVAIGEQNQIYRANGERFFYDAMGNVRMRESFTKRVYYVRDGLNRLREVRELYLAVDPAEQSLPDYQERAWQERQQARLVLQCVYDALDRRIRKTHFLYDSEESTEARDTEVWQFVWDEQRLAAEIFPSGAFRLYVYADDIALVPMAALDYASIDAAPESGEFYSFHADQRGAIEAVRDDFGSIVWQAKLGPYGEVQGEECAFSKPGKLSDIAQIFLSTREREQATDIHTVRSVPVGNRAHEPRFHQPFRLVGQYFDEETGLAHQRHRNFDAQLGRFLERDPIGLAGGMNVYAWPECPLDALDPLGLACPRVRAQHLLDGDAEGLPEGRISIRARLAELDADPNDGPRPNARQLRNPERYAFNTGKNKYERLPGIRAQNYPSGFTAHVWERLALNHTQEGQRQRGEGRSDGRPMRSDGRGGEEPIPFHELTWLDDRDSPVAFDDLSFDHVVPCAELWNNGATVHDPGPPPVTRTHRAGHNASRQERHAAFNDPANLRPASRRENSSKGSLMPDGSRIRYRRETGANYSNNKRR